MSQAPTPDRISQPEALTLPAAGAGAARATLLQRVLAFEGLEAIAAIAMWKLGTFITVYLASSLLPFNRQLYNDNLRFGDRDPSSFADALTTWDAQHFLLLAERGYREGLLSNAFGPLYPMLIRAFNVVTGDSIVSGLLISNVASGVALYLLYELVKQRWSQAVAFATLLLFIAFPTAFYLNLIYTEGLFLLLLVVLFYALYRRAFHVAALAAFLLPLLRMPGLVGAVPLAWVLVSEALKDARFSFDFERGLRVSNLRWSRDLLYLLAPVAGLLVYLGYMHIELGNAFAAMDAEKQYITERGLDHLLRPDRTIADLFRGDLTLHGYLDSKLDRIFFVAFVASLPLVYTRVDKPMFVFCLIIGMQAFLGSFMSYPRLVMVAFPLYIAYATLLAGPRPQLLFAAVYPMLMLQTFLLSMHVLGNWVA